MGHRVILLKSASWAVIVLIVCPLSHNTPKARGKNATVIVSTPVSSSFMVRAVCKGKRHHDVSGSPSARHRNEGLFGDAGEIPSQRRTNRVGGCEQARLSHGLL